MLDKQEVTIGGARFNWDQSAGLLQFEGADVVLFWTKTTLKTFISTIEEVTGKESASVVMEAAGYRIGKTVSGFYKERGTNTEEILAQLPEIYAAAGWGTTKIIKSCLKEKRIVLSVHNDWESKVAFAQGKKEPGQFLGGHWAGVLSGLLDETIWYKIKEFSLAEADSYKVIELYPAPITPSENVRDYIQTLEQQKIMQLEAMVEDRTIELKNIIRELASPVVPVLEGILVTPLMGRFDQERSDEFIEKALYAIVDYKAHMLILDVTGIYEMNSLLLSMIEKIIQSVRLIGAVPILAGISPELSMEMTEKGLYLKDVKCFSTLKHAVHYAIALDGMHLVRIENE